MRKRSFIIIAIALMMLCLAPFSFATEEKKEENEEQTETVATEENDNQEVQEIQETVTNTYGKVTENNGIKEVLSGTIVDQVQEVVIEITKGDYVGEEFTTEYVLSYDLEGKMLVPELSVGDTVEMQITEDKEGNVSATILGVSRIGHAIWFFIFFLASILVVGGKKGIRTILGLLFTLLFIYLFMMKRILVGANVILTSIFTSLIVIFGTFIIICGLNKKSISATLGTFCGVLSAGLIALIFISFAKMTGSFEDAINLSVNLSTINFKFKDLLFAQIIISTLGACMDIGISIASGLEEIKLTESEITWKELFKKGMAIGRENIGTMTNTLILAYFGSSLTLLLLFKASNMSIFEIINREMITEAFMLAIIGSMGVVYTVPITSIIYALINRHKVIYKRVAENKVDGKRSLRL